MPHRALSLPRTDSQRAAGADAPAARHELEGPVLLRHNGGPVFRSEFRMVVEECGVLVSYSDGIEHVLTDPTVIAFFVSALVPSLQAAERG